MVTDTGNLWRKGTQKIKKKETKRWVRKGEQIFPPKKEKIEDATQNRKLVHCDARERQASAATKREDFASKASPKHD